MNKIYRVIWNAVLGVWQAVSEICRARGKVKSSKAARLAVTTILMSHSALSFAAGELPTGGEIVGGSGSIQQSGNSMTITQETARMVANWQTFSIGQGNSVNFIQPSSSSVALNRVLGSDVSVIQGNLTANGQIFLVNPNGVLFS